MEIRVHEAEPEAVFVDGGSPTDNVGSGSGAFVVLLRHRFLKYIDFWISFHIH